MFVTWHRLQMIILRPLRPVFADRGLVRKKRKRSNKKWSLGGRSSYGPPKFVPLCKQFCMHKAYIKDKGNIFNLRKCYVLVFAQLHFVTVW